MKSHLSISFLVTGAEKATIKEQVFIEGEAVRQGLRIARRSKCAIVSKRSYDIFIMRRYGLDGNEPWSYKKIGEWLGVCYETARAIDNKIISNTRLAWHRYLRGKL